MQFNQLMNLSSITFGWKVSNVKQKLPQGKENVDKFGGKE